MLSDLDPFVLFRNVSLISQTATSLFCRIGKKRVWLPRRHVRGRLLRIGDRGTLLIRRWIALDRSLPVPAKVTAAIATPGRRRASALRLARAMPKPILV